MRPLTFRSSRLPWLRLRSGRGRLLCLVGLPIRSGPTGRFAAELALVASPTAPRLRRLTVLRRLDAGAHPDGAPRAA